jgi:hypothetical protein
LHPLDMRENLVDAQPNELAIQIFELPSLSSEKLRTL